MTALPPGLRNAAGRRKRGKTLDDLAAAVAALAERGVTSLPPLAFVLGSGLGPLADEAENAVSIPYTEIPGFPQPSVAGHKGRLVVGELEGRRVALFQGRGHYYERGDPARWRC